MSLAGIASSVLSILGGLQANSSPKPQFGSNSISTEFQQLGQDLQSGNLSQAQQDFATLSQNLPGGIQAVRSFSPSTAATSTTLSQVVALLGNDLQSGNLSAAQSDFTTLQQDLQGVGAQGGQIHGHRHHRHHAERPQDSPSSTQVSQNNSITQEFSALAQSLQSGNLQGAQSAFAALRNDLQQIGGISPPTLNASPTAGSLNVNV
jgi:hypothetical protein